MKKRLLFVALVFGLLLTACNRTPAETPNGDTATTTTAPLVGENDGVTYKNAHFGIAFAPADGWDLFDAEEIADRNLPILAMDEGESYADAVNHAKEFYDMYAVQESTGNTIAVRVENMATMYESVLTAEEYRNIQLSMLEGIPSLTAEPFTATVDGKEFPGMKVLWGEGDDVQTDVSVYVIKDTYMLSIDLSSTDGDHTDEWLSRFDLL